MKKERPAVMRVVQSDPVVAAVIGGTDLQRAIVAGAGARPVDPMGNPWSGCQLLVCGGICRHSGGRTDLRCPRGWESLRRR